MRVAIVHPWFPQYRKPFFDEIIALGSNIGIEIDVFHGAPPPEWNDRGDSVSETYATPMHTKFFGLRGRHLVYKSPWAVWNRGPYDVLILEQAVRNLETYAFLFHRRRTRIAFWGHGKTFTTEVGRFQELVKQFLTKRGHWFFAYTPSGGRAVSDAGFCADRITIVQNSVDSASLETSIAGISIEDRQAFDKKYDLKGKTGLFIGGLDTSKRLDFLIEASDRVYATDNEFRLIVAGRGSLQGFIERAASERPWLLYLGSLFGEEKAMAMAASDVLLMPGRVGLVAVDSFASATPIITTDWPWHAPEFEYLEADHNAVVTENDVISYSNAITNTLKDSKALHRLREAASESARKYTVAKMASNFVHGLELLRNDQTSS